MIVNVRGACGAGKSTLVKNVLEELLQREGRLEQIAAPGRKKPIGYCANNVFVPGHYEIQNGGLDTIGDLEEAHKWIAAFHEQEFDVLFEGMNQKKDAAWLQRYGKDLVVVFLDLPIEKCREGFAAKGQKRTVDYVKSTWEKARREQFQFRELGITCFSEETRESALERVRDILKMTGDSK